jgi:prepilin-type N-terminal cleavage/methylation domain-containing protein
MKIKHIGSQSGISLLEVMVAMIILSISLLLLLDMAMVALDGNDWSNKTTLATQMLQEKLEELRSTAVLDDGSDSADGIARSWTITNLGSHLRRVDVQVTWQDVRSRTKSNSMTAFIKTDSV